MTLWRLHWHPLVPQPLCVGVRPKVTSSDAVQVQSVAAQAAGKPARLDFPCSQDPGRSTPWQGQQSLAAGEPGLAGTGARVTGPLLAPVPSVPHWCLYGRSLQDSQRVVLTFPPNSPRPAPPQARLVEQGEEKEAAHPPGKENAVSFWCPP